MTCMGHKICYLEVCSFPINFYSNGQRLPLLGSHLFEKFQCTRKPKFQISSCQSLWIQTIICSNFKWMACKGHKIWQFDDLGECPKGTPTLPNENVWENFNFKMLYLLTYLCYRSEIWSDNLKTSTPMIYVKFRLLVAAFDFYSKFLKR